MADDLFLTYMALDNSVEVYEVNSRLGVMRTMHELDQKAESLNKQGADVQNFYEFCKENPPPEYPDYGDLAAKGAGKGLLYGAAATGIASGISWLMTKDDPSKNITIGKVLTIGAVVLPIGAILGSAFETSRIPSNYQIDAAQLVDYSNYLDNAEESLATPNAKVGQVKATQRVQANDKQIN